MRFLIYLLTSLFFTTGCALNAHDQSRLEPFEKSEFFADNLSARSFPPNTIPHGYSTAPEGFYTGQTAGGDLLETFPLPVTQRMIEQGRIQYEVFCLPCHGESGEGDGIIVQRGFSQPPSFQLDRLRQAPVGHFFQVMTYGIGAMYSYEDALSPEDRWAITAYIQTLQQRSED